jgi:hypothetical protein
MAGTHGPTSSVLRLRAEPSAVRRARDFVQDRCAAITESARDAVVLMVSELVTNAVRHGSPPIAVMVHGARWGVQVIDALATAWGVRLRPIGKAVWFILLDDQRAPAVI